LLEVNLQSSGVEKRTLGGDASTNLDIGFLYGNPTSEWKPAGAAIVSAHDPPLVCVCETVEGDDTDA
jgi:hypothetical protein